MGYVIIILLILIYFKKESTEIILEEIRDLLYKRTK